ncbi:MAG: dihydrodipicolinate synthase family protein [Rhodothermales bacterium]
MLAPNLTPFEDDGRIAETLYVEHAKRLLDEGCAGLIPFGTTGEAASVGNDERIRMLDRLVEAGIPASRLMPGTGLTSLLDTVRLTRHAVEAGCLGVLVLPPFYYKAVSDDGLFAYFARLIEDVGEGALRIVLYHIPQVAGVGLSVPLVRRLREAFPETVVGIKDSSGDWANTSALLEIEGLSVYPGTELLMPQALAAGSPGCITATANVNAAALARLAQLIYDDPGTVTGAFEPVRQVRLAVQQHPPISALKAILAHRTGDDRWRNARPPLVPLSNDQRAALERRSC